MNDEIKHILFNGTPGELRALFSFNVSDPQNLIRKKFNLWGRYFFPKYYPVSDAPFHAKADIENINVYLGNIDHFLNIVHRDGAKTTRTKLFFAFAILNDNDHSRRYIKVLSKEGKNSTQFVTDVYNMFVQPRVKALYPETFTKSNVKREETKSSFTTSTGVKLAAGTVGTEQRGNIQENARPDIIIFDDFETRATLRSAVVGQAIWDNMEEARTGLAKGGGCIYLCNYISERGNVHRFVERYSNKIIIPIIKDGKPTWPARFTLEDINSIKATADDFEGEYLCLPSASKDIYFDREKVDLQQKREPIETIAGFRIFAKYDASHRYGAGADIAGGVGLDSSTAVFIDFSTIPANVVGVFANNEIKPDVFGHELKRQGDYFGQPLIAPENNKFDTCIGTLKGVYPLEKIFRMPLAPDRVYVEKLKDYGWNTNSHTKSEMLSDFYKAIKDGLINLNDEHLIREVRQYTRDDSMDREEDVRLTTRHFDLLTACLIAFQMRKYAVAPPTQDEYVQPDYQRPGFE